MKKRICTILSIAMVLSLAISSSVFANDTEENPTIDNPIIINGDETPLLNLRSGDGYLDKSFENSYWFPMPDNGHASIRIKVWYTEYYTPSGSNAIFKERTKAVVFNRQTMAYLPDVEMYNISHTGDVIFNTWELQPMWMDGIEWNGGRMFLNTKSITYPKNTSRIGTLPFTVFCEGALLPMRPEKIELPLKVV